jgi:DNA replication protein DnaC
LRGMIRKPALNALLGTRGPGKTHMACAMVREACRCGKSARYSTALDIFRAIRGTWGKQEKGEESESKVITKLERADVLIIDEVQVRSESAWENTILSDLIDHRYGFIKSTLLIANLEPKALAANVGESIASRLLGSGKVMVCDWPSFRKSGMAQPEPRTEFPPVDECVADLIPYAKVRYRSW